MCFTSFVNIIFFLIILIIKLNIKTNILKKILMQTKAHVCNMYISLYSLPFTGFESLPESVQTNLSKSPRTPQVICPATWSLFPGGH